MKQLRKIRSFVRREGRRSQLDSPKWKELWSMYGADTFSQINFPKSQNIILEIGFGDGRNLHAQAKNNPGMNYLGVEVYKTGAMKVMTSLQEEGINNVQISCTDVVELLDDAPDDIFTNILVFFPDPWQKKRHHKRRLLQKNFLLSLLPKLKPKGEIHIATDWANYAEHIEEFLPELVDFYICDKPEERSVHRVITKFEQRAIDDGRNIFEYKLTKR